MPSNRAFANANGTAGFSRVSEPLTSSDYLQRKKTKHTFCTSSNCLSGTAFRSEGQHLLWKQRQQLLRNPYPYFDHTQLYINLYTHLDLSELRDASVPVVADLSGNTFPIVLNPEVNPLLTYVVDPSGALFGNSVCDINQYVQYMDYSGTSA